MVYKARQTTPHRIVAIKMLKAGMDASPERLDRFRAGSEVVAGLQHANVVQIFEVGDHYGRPYIEKGALTRRAGSDERLRRAVPGRATVRMRPPRLRGMTTRAFRTGIAGILRTRGHELAATVRI